MSLLWKKKKILKEKKGDNVDRTFPKFFISELKFAQLFLPHFFGLISQRLSSIQKNHEKSIKGISACTSRKVLASMTVEASLVLPLFLLFFLQVGSVMEMMRFHGRMEVALWEVGREMSLYGSPLIVQIQREMDHSSEGSRQLMDTIGNLTVSYIYVKARVEDYLGREYLESAPIKNGRAGLQYIGSRVLQENEQVDVVVTYLASPHWHLEGFPLFVMENHYVGRAWTGFDITEKEELGYYLAENMDVFHRDPDCSHLHLKAARVTWEGMLSSTNAKEKKYRACRRCVERLPVDHVWISPEGECFHVRENCPGLKRTVREVCREEALRYRPCARCGYISD